MNHQFSSPEATSYQNDVVFQRLSEIREQESCLINETNEAMGQTSFTELNEASFNKSSQDRSYSMPVMYNNENSGEL